jgi:DNA-binding GntR family transcriptional regulator
MTLNDTTKSAESADTAFDIHIPISRQSLSDEVYDVLFTKLIRLEIPPGTRIAIDTLSREMQVSQTPIREALIRLEQQGLVVKVHRLGYQAAVGMTYEKFEHMFDLRLLLEPYAAALTAKNLTEATKLALTTLADDMKALSGLETSQAYEAFTILDAQFHALIAQESGNALVKESLDRAYAHAHLFRLTYYTGANNLESGIAEHTEIIESIVTANMEKAEAAMKSHMVCSKMRLKSYFDGKQ